MRFAFKRNLSPVAYCALTIRSGTRDEGSAPNGTAHFTEHLLFKGTESKGASQINNCLERYGGELNAYTTKEETVIHAAVLKGDLRKGISLIVELAFKSLFRQSDIEREKGIVIDEIQSFKDSPPEAIYDHFEELLLKGSPLGGQILGDIRSVRKISKADIDGYVTRNFTSERMALTVVADIDERKAIDAANAALSRFGLEPVSRHLPDSGVYLLESSLKPGNVFDMTLNKRNHQANCIIGTTAYPIACERKRIALVLLCNILGGPAANSRLNTLLRERNGWVYGVEAMYTPYSDNGVAAISFGCDQDNLDRCINAVYRELRKAREIPMTPTALQRAKKQLKGQLLISSDNGENKCLAMGKNILTFGSAYDETQGVRTLEEITPEELRECAEEIFSEHRLSKLIYL